MLYPSLKTFFVFIFLACIVNKSNAQGCVASSWHDATSFSTNSSVGVYDFSNPGNAQVSDNNRSSATSIAAIGSGSTYYLVATGFGFSIPSNYLICGISVEVQSRATGLLLAASIKDNSVKLVKNGSITGNNQAISSAWGSSDSYNSYGSSSDSWGLALTPDDVNASNFGVAISAKINAVIGVFPSADINYIHMKIYYNNTVLPVILQYFKASRSNNLINLQWKTAEEEDNASIYVQRSFNNGDWTDIAQYKMQTVNVGKTYSYSETMNQKGFVQYRLRIRSASGHDTYSEIKSFTINEIASFNIYPNPASDYIIVEANKASVTDVYGRTCNLPQSNLNNRIKINVAQLPKGIYFVHTNNSAAKFIKE